MRKLRNTPYILHPLEVAQIISTMTDDQGVRMLWLADKLANMRSLASGYSEYVEREIAMARKAFILGIPTAISFGIVSVGDKYEAMYELVDSETISSCIVRNPSQVEAYAKMMSELALTIHGTGQQRQTASLPEWSGSANISRAK